MACIGLVFSLFFIYVRREKLKMKFKDLAEYLLTCAVLGFVGARLLFVISMLPSMKQITINEIFYYLKNGGLVFYGGLMGVLCGIVVNAKYKKENVKEKLNLLTPVFPLFHAFARFGCLLAGCCYGRQWSWGVIMASEPGVIRFPVQLIESLCDIIIFIGLMVWEKKEKPINTIWKYICVVMRLADLFWNFIEEMKSEESGLGDYLQPSMFLWAFGFAI